MAKVTRSKKSLPREEIKRLKELARKIDREEGAAIQARAARYKRESQRLQAVFRQLKDERERQGLSLADISACSGIDKARLSRLENDPYPNVQMDTIERYAAALGKRVMISLVDAA